jgi:hypothetical protein
VSTLKHTYCTVQHNNIMILKIVIECYITRISRLARELTVVNRQYYTSSIGLLSNVGGKRVI